MVIQFQRFTQRARRGLTAAQEVALPYRHNYIGTEHILLGLLGDEGNTATKVLAHIGVQAEDLRAAVHARMRRKDPMGPKEFGLTPRAKKSIELAAAEARQLDHTYVGTEHLLLGLIGAGEGIAAEVFVAYGLDLERVRLAVREVLDSSESTGSEDEPSGG